MDPTFYPAGGTYVAVFNWRPSDGEPIKEYTRPVVGWTWRMFTNERGQKERDDTLDPVILGPSSASTPDVLEDSDCYCGVVAVDSHNGFGSEESFQNTLEEVRREGASMREMKRRMEQKR